MDLEQAQKIIDSLFFDVNGYTISAQARDKRSHFDKAYTYGEITVESFFRILKDANPQPGEVFYDLGSGTGKAVIVAAMQNVFSKCIGIEILEDLVRAADSVLARYEIEIEPHLNFSSPSEIEFIVADFLKHDFSNAGVIFAHSTCFYDEVMVKLERKFSSLKPGTRVITVTKALQSPYFHLLKSNEYNLGWGKATVNIYKKI